jgi:hypothetical protein
MTEHGQAGAPELSLFGSPWKQAVTGVVLVAWFYLIGWVYTYFYLRFFHIDIFELDIPLEYIFVQAITPVEFSLWNYWLYLTGIIVLSGAVIFSIRRCTVRPVKWLRELIHRYRKRLVFPSAIAVAALLYIVGFQIAALAATNRAQEVWTSDAPEIQFTFADDEKGVIEQSKLGALNTGYDLRYLLATKDFFTCSLPKRCNRKTTFPTA